MTTTATEQVTETAPDYVIPCWVSQTRSWDARTLLPLPNPCVDLIAEWLTTTGGRIATGYPQWRPTCTGCKDRFVRLNPDTRVRSLS